MAAWTIKTVAFKNGKQIDVVRSNGNAANEQHGVKTAEWMIKANLADKVIVECLFGRNVRDFFYVVNGHGTQKVVAQ